MAANMSPQEKDELMRTVQAGVAVGKVLYPYVNLNLCFYFLL